ncbi:N-acetylneuraminate synthase family protein [Rhizobium sp. AG855]|uniref:N-acetylneuraminate synthase family protein n=1 Tax=Rhizobium sp. AG855 TaxID=2183898 RepID=UPI000E709F89|nr:N-acetylneuraminate synthase family protein [Rhizobium sp. AG855]RKE85543.1 N-acetylneuraminate synthase [Rhizobium sp. AG855]
MKIGNRHIGPEHRPFIIAEIAQGHDGSLGNAMAFIEAAKACGADAIKFQTHIASEESTRTEPWRVPFSKQDVTRYGYWERTGFSLEQWRLLKKHADDVGIVFMSSPFSILACQWLQELGVPAWKLASGEVHNKELVDWVSATDKPIILSSGLSSVDETLTLALELKRRGNEIAVLHCTTSYPTPPSEVGLNVMSHFLSELDVPVGLSDHSGSSYPGTVAAYLGASIIEVHLAWHEKMFGPDTSSSLTPEGLKALRNGVDFAYQMRVGNVDKDEQLQRLAKERSIFRRSIVASQAISAGTLIEEHHLSYKKPGGGMSFEQRNQLIGKRTRSSVEPDHIFKVEDVE